jgi:hypothetical protein
MRRFYPDLFTSEVGEPILEYVEIAAESASAGSSGREQLVAAAPVDLVRTVTEALAEHGVTISGWTIAPRALQRLHAAFGDPALGEAVVLLLPGIPLLGLFHGGALRLVSEPAGASAATGDLARTVGELVSLDRVLVAGDRASTPAVVAELRAGRGLEVQSFGDQEPGALLALGAALDAEQPDRLSLLPPAARPLSRSERLTRMLAVASVAVLIAASAWWTSDALHAEREARGAIEQLRSRLVDEQVATEEIRTAVMERQAHAERSALLEILARRHNRLPEVLWPLQAAAPEVGVTRLRVSPSEEGWRVDLTASARGRSSAEATDAVDALVRQLEAQLPGGRVSLSQMAYAPPASPVLGSAPLEGVGLTFEISFTVPDPEEPQG